ncbi:MAG: dihydroneopterin aldolase [Pseudomonadota bacterium]
MDTIHITNIRCYGYTGFFPEEKKLGQWFSIDLTIELDLLASCNSDKLQDTLDYSLVIDAIKTLVKREKPDLIERLAEAVAKEILSFSLPHTVRVQLTKISAPIPDFDGEITIDITRTKASNG